MSSAGEQSAQQARTPDRKTEIAAIGAELFSEHGYHNVALADIAHAAGITGPAIYRHFPNKQAILTHAANDFAAALSDQVEPLVRGTGPALQRLDAAIHGIVRLVVSRRRHVRLYLYERRHLDPTDHAELVQAVTTLATTVAALLGHVRPKLSKRDRQLFALAALSAIASLSTHRVSAGTRTSERTLRSLARAVLAAQTVPRAEGDEPAPETPRPGDTWFASRRELLLASAVRPLRSQGFHGASMEDLGHAAGIGASSVYRHFTSKADLLAAVYYRAADRLSAATGTATAGARSPREALERLVHSYVRVTFDSPDLVAVYLSEYENLPRTDRRELRRVQREHIEMWVRIVSACRDTPRPKSTRLAVHAALNVVHDLSLTDPRLATPVQVEHLVLTILEC